MDLPGGNHFGVGLEKYPLGSKVSQERVYLGGTPFVWERGVVPLGVKIWGRGKRGSINIEADYPGRRNIPTKGG